MRDRDAKLIWEAREKIDLIGLGTSPKHLKKRISSAPYLSGDNLNYLVDWLEEFLKKSKKRDKGPDKNIDPKTGKLIRGGDPVKIHDPKKQQEIRPPVDHSDDIKQIKAVVDLIKGELNENEYSDYEESIARKLLRSANAHVHRLEVYSSGATSHADSLDRVERITNFSRDFELHNEDEFNNTVNMLFNQLSDEGSEMIEVPDEPFKVINPSSRMIKLTTKGGKDFEIYNTEDLSSQQTQIVDDLSPTKHWKDNFNVSGPLVSLIKIDAGNKDKKTYAVYSDMQAFTDKIDRDIKNNPSQNFDPFRSQHFDPFAPQKAIPSFDEKQLWKTWDLARFVEDSLVKYTVKYGKKEGNKSETTSLSPLRSKSLIEKAKEENIEKYGALTCMKCGVQPAKDYYFKNQKVSPSLANRIIEGHHIHGVRETDKATTKDIELLCKNCHIYETRISK